MTELREKDAMECRACGREERASEGYPCVACGTFICVMCSFRGIVKCRACIESENKPTTPPQEIPLIDWPQD